MYSSSKYTKIKLTLILNCTPKVRQLLRESLLAIEVSIILETEFLSI